MKDVNNAFKDVFDEIKPRRLAIREFTKVFITEMELTKIIARMNQFWLNEIEELNSSEESKRCDDFDSDFASIKTEA